MIHCNQLIQRLVMIALLSFLPSQATAQITTWRNGNGIWTNPASWTNGVPNASTLAQFSGVDGEQRYSLLQFGTNLNTAYSITFQSIDTHTNGFGPRLDYHFEQFDNVSNSRIDTGNILVRAVSGASYTRMRVTIGAIADDYPINKHFTINMNRLDVSSNKSTAVAELHLNNATLNGSNFVVDGSAARLGLHNSTFNGSGGLSRVNNGATLITSGTARLNNMNLQVSTGGEWLVYDDISFSGELLGDGDIWLFGGNLNLTGNQTDTIHHTFSGDTGLRISNGIKTLTASNTFNGGLFLDGGTLKVSGGSRTGALDNTIHFNGGTFELTHSSELHTETWQVDSASAFRSNSGVNAEIHGDFTGNGTLEKIGGGKLRLFGNNSGFDGEFLVTDGVLLAGINNSLGGNTKVTVGANGEFRLQDDENWGSLSGEGFFDLGNKDAKIYETGSSIISGVVDGTGQFEMAGTGRLTLSDSSDLAGMSGTILASEGTLEIQGAAIGQVVGDVDSTAGGTIELNTFGQNISFNGHIDNDGVLLKTGSGTLTISDNSAGDLGVVEVSQGVLSSGRVHGYTLVLSGGEFRVTSDATTKNLVAAAGTLGTLNTTTNFQLMDWLGGSGTLVKTGSGSLEFVGNSFNANSFTGALFIQNGVVENIPHLANAHVSIRANGEMTVGLEERSIGSLAGSGKVQFFDDGTGITPSIRVGGDNSSTSYSGQISGDGTVFKTGTGTWSLNGTTDSANLIVEQGTLEIGSANAFGSTTQINDGAALSVSQSLTTQKDIRLNSGTAFVNSNEHTLTLGGNLTGDADLVKQGTGSLILSGNADGFSGAYVAEAGNLVLNALPANNSQTNIDVNADAVLRFDTDIDYAGSIGGSGTVDLTQGSGDVRLRGNNGAFAGNIVVGNARNLSVGQGDSLGNSTDLTILAGARVEIEAVEHWGGLFGAGTLDLNNISSVQAGRDNEDMSFAGDIVGSTTFEKHGTGNFDFDGDASALGGEFQVVNGSLSGDGTFADLHIFDGATLTPGNSPGTMEMLSLVLDAGSLVEIELGGLLEGSEYDQLIVSGNADVSGDLSVEFINGFQLDRDQEFLIVDIHGSLNGQFAGLSEGDVVTSQGGRDLYITYQAGSGNGIALFSVPEPGSTLLISLMAGLAMIGRRRRV